MRWGSYSLFCLRPLPRAVKQLPLLLTITSNCFLLSKGIEGITRRQTGLSATVMLFSETRARDDLF